MACPVRHRRIGALLAAGNAPSVPTVTLLANGSNLNRALRIGEVKQGDKPRSRRKCQLPDAWLGAKYEWAACAIEFHGLWQAVGHTELVDRHRRNSCQRVRSLRRNKR